MIRSLISSDQTAVVNLLRLNTPKYFHQSEEQDFIQYLNTEAEDYYVVERNNEIVGAGGINYGFDGGSTARISWDLVNPNYQGMGIGSELTQFRITKLKHHKNTRKIVVRTTQLVFEFYKKNGFTLHNIEEGYWAEGFDLYEMSMPL